MSGRRGFLGLTASAVAAGAVPVVTQAAPVNPDAELIRLCEQHLAAGAAFNADGLDSDLSPHWKVYIETEEVIHNTHATTIAGLQAKARIMWTEATQPDGTLDDLAGAADAWAWEIAEDLLAMGGAQA